MLADEEKLIEENLNLIYYVLKKYGKLYDEDLFQNCAIAMLRGLRTWDKSKQLQLSTYLVICMVNEIRLQKRIEGYKKNIPKVSLNNALYDDDRLTLESLICVEDDFSDDLIDKLLVDRLLSRLTEDEKMYIKMHYFEGLTYDQIGKKVYMTRQGVQYRIKQALKKMKEFYFIK
jgi:RNA polymerase sigma factor (sigma-70 family)